MKVRIEYVIDEIEEWHSHQQADEKDEPQCALGNCTCYQIIDMLKEMFGVE